MAIFLPDWQACAALQHQLSTNYSAGTQSVGLEAALDRFVVNAFEQRPSPGKELQRVASTARRRLRHRGALIMRQGPACMSVDPRASLEAADTLARLQRSMPSAKWELVTAVADGESYATLAAQRGVTVQSLRVSVHRSRRYLRTMMDS